MWDERLSTQQAEEILRAQGRNLRRVRQRGEIDAVAAAVNLTVAGGSSGGYVSVWAGNQQTPFVGNIDFSANQTRANNAIVAVANDGSGLVAAYANAYDPVHLIIDVDGYFK